MSRICAISGEALRIGDLRQFGSQNHTIDPSRTYSVCMKNVGVKWTTRKGGVMKSNGIHVDAEHFEGRDNDGGRV